MIHGKLSETDESKELKHPNNKLQLTPLPAASYLHSAIVSHCHWSKGCLYAVCLLVPWNYAVWLLLLLHLPGVRAIYHLHPWKEALEENGSLAGKRLSPGSILALHQVWLAATFTQVQPGSKPPGMSRRERRRQPWSGCSQRQRLEHLSTRTPRFSLPCLGIGHKSRKRKASGRNSCVQLVNQPTSTLLWFL